MDDRSTQISRLERLLMTEVLAPQSQRAGTHLLRRLKSDICVVLAGPHETGKAAVLPCLNARTLPHTQIQIVQWGEDLPRDGADVCIWFTQGFSADEQDQWKPMPNRLKDHSFLSPVTQATPYDPAFLDAMDAIAMEEFCGLYPLILHSSNSTPQSDGIDRLVAQIAHIIESGQTADAGNVQRFLAQNAVTRSDAQSPPDKDRSSPVEQALLPSLEAPVVARALPPAPEPIKPQPQETSSDLVLFRQAHEGLCTQITALEPLKQAKTEAEFAQVLATCQETLEETASLLSDCQTPGWDDVQSAADEVLLMSMEGGVEPAITAVTTLLQIKRQLEVEVRINDAVFT